MGRPARGRRALIAMIKESQSLLMTARPDQQSHQKGYAAGLSGARPKCPEGMDRLAYASGYVEGRTARMKRSIRHDGSFQVVSEQIKSPYLDR
jgi:hypothetical protein